MAWPTLKSCIHLIIQLITIQFIASQDKYINRPHSEIYNKNRLNTQFSLRNNTGQNINTRQFPSGYNTNFIESYNPPHYQQQQQFGYSGGNGINHPGINAYGYPGATISGYPGGTGIGFPTPMLSGYPGGIGLGSPSFPHEKGLLFPPPFGHYPPQNFQPSPTLKPMFQPTSHFNIPQGFGGFYPNFPYWPAGTQIPVTQNPQTQSSTFYPGGGNGSPHDGFDIGSLPRQVRVPGVIQVTLSGRDAEIVCEFPRHLLLIQGIYWHHKYDPFGSYFDTKNGFAPRVTVESYDKWKSVLRINEYSEDDFGIYRCISAAALPTDDKNIQFQGGFSNRNGKLSSTTEVYSDSGHSQAFDSGESQSRDDKVNKRKNGRKMKFPPTKKMRFARQTDDMDHSIDRDDLFPSATDPSTYLPTTNEPYDPFINNRNFEYPVHLRNSYPDYNKQNSFNNDYRYHNNIPNQNSFISDLHSNRHLLLPNFGNYPGLGFSATTFPHSHAPFPHSHSPFPHSQRPGFGLQVPYYKPSYSIYTVFQEILFQPATDDGVRSTEAISSTSSIPINT